MVIKNYLWLLFIVGLLFVMMFVSFVSCFEDDDDDDILLLVVIWYGEYCSLFY